ncbi:hypothetical protein [Sporomusa sphaeroides]|uniref:hypothetical protein n=1 Tax=Sporomusa sphaeroides TaxID=47679 RepID=UPI001300EF31|nr:hypothetical protein [Sporomusa sphaeroides]
MSNRGRGAINPTYDGAVISVVLVEILPPIRAGSADTHVLLVIINPGVDPRLCAVDKFN